MTSRQSQSIVMDSAVASPHWRATEAGRDVLAAGGNALDAALATNAMLWACYPHMCGLGGDIWILYFDAATSRVHCLNGSGGAPRSATVEEYARRGHTRVPAKGPLSMAVPGAAAGWDHASRRFGSIPVPDLLRPAAKAARDGVEITPKLAGWMAKDRELLAGDPVLATVFTNDGELLPAGATFRQSALAATIDRIADAGFADFYRGELGEAIARGSLDAGGLLTTDDLKAHASLWVQPVTTRFDGVQVVTTPPNSQGVAALEILNLLSVLEGGRAAPGSARQLNAFLEARRLAYMDRNQYLGDPAHVTVPVDMLASLDHARRVADNAHATPRKSSAPLEGDTVYLCAVDRWGNACSVIQSIYHSFGSGFVPAGTGVLMGNRGAYFSLDKQHPNVIAPGKRPVHTLMASMALKDGRPWLLFGTMGGEGQPQTNVQVLLRVLAGASPAEAVAAPRVLNGQIFPDDAEDQLHVEEDLGAEVIAELQRLGHDVKVVPMHDEMMGHAHAIVIDGDRVQAGADPRSDGSARVHLTTTGGAW
ncbi:gamma-glutamyltransferase family protein [Streptomyces brasiliensis]|uniref:Gamma-glutamyltranspeptidase n=1 Tax=Streptomyces brasiliensis TaxID=1954 RepID=A0A917P995_9ACTN|nr:gamma-glutamyltransferase family protein [Streptomyces brasiliensis]GGJ67115.1 gamma-glutamyltranspeptidase [Streptomyces brasiliensis]